jgi:hypothetical protein|tara:strand:+ start:1153 stop:1284 length:132 start_codon:yes stop_codon:yes gene_type:complete
MRVFSEENAKDIMWEFCLWLQETHPSTLHTLMKAYKKSKEMKE